MRLLAVFGGVLVFGVVLILSSLLDIGGQRYTELEQEILALRRILERIQYAEKRRRKPQFRGPFPSRSSFKPGVCDLGHTDQWACMPMQMRYAFSMKGKVGVNWKEPSAEGKESEKTGVALSQLPRQLWKVLKFRNGKPFWSKKVVDTLVSAVKRGEDISCQDYPDSAPDVELAMRVVGVKGKHVLVGGSISPWVESVALALGASRTTTSDYNAAESRHPLLDTIAVPELLDELYYAGTDSSSSPSKKVGQTKFEVVASYSSVEHDGLGRYGDPLDPDGDFHAMRELWDLTAPGGTLLLAVPSWFKDYIHFTSARVYGPLRLPELLSQDPWEYAGCVFQSEFRETVPLSPQGDCDMWGRHPVILLRKPLAPYSAGVGTGAGAHALRCTLACEAGDDVCRPHPQHCKGKVPVLGGVHQVLEVLAKRQTAEERQRRHTKSSDPFRRFMFQAQPRKSKICIDQAAQDPTLKSLWPTPLAEECSHDLRAHCKPEEHPRQCTMNKFSRLSSRCVEADGYLRVFGEWSDGRCGSKCKKESATSQPP